MLPRSRRARLAIVVIALVAAAYFLWFSGSETIQHLERPSPIDASPDQIARGMYLARLGNCVSCHTRPGGQEFVGGRMFRTTYGFLGRLYSTNITPDIATGIGGWTEAQFLRALREGRSPSNHWYLPAFPYANFARLTDEDGKAIFAYLRTLTPVSYSPPRNSFAMRQRWAIGLWNRVFVDEPEVRSPPGRSKEWERGAYLVEGLGHCGACHTPRTRFLAEERDEALSGNAYFETDGAGHSQRWFAVNLTPAPEGLAAWSADDIAKYLRTGHSRRGGIFGPMNDVVVNSLQHLTEADARAMAVYLKNLEPLSRLNATTKAPKTNPEGERAYVAHCEKCHMSTGRGAFLKAPPLAGSAIVQGQDPASLINVILHGARVGAGSPTPFGAWEDMPSFADKLADQDAANLASYVRSAWGNHAGIVTQEMVAAQR